MKNPNVEICSLLEARMNETIQEINKTDSIFDADKLHSELRILDWIFYQYVLMRRTALPPMKESSNIVLYFFGLF